MYGRVFVTRFWYIAAAALLVVSLASACGEDRLTSITQAGRGLTMNVRDLQQVDGIIYQDEDFKYYSVGPAQPGHQLVVAEVTIWNNLSGRLSLFVNEEAALLQGADGREFDALDPYGRRVELNEAPAALSPHLPFLWGPSDLPQDFNISGWMVFEVPDDLDITRLEWEQVDSLRFPLSLS